MSIFRRNKKLILSLLLIAVVIAGVFGVGQGVLATSHEPPAAPPTTGNAIGDIMGSSGWVWGIILRILIAIQVLFSKLLVLAGYFLNLMFEINIGFVPSLEPVVQVGWIVLRDIVNGVFIMLVLWIALTIILGIEQFGGKRLLAKVLAVAVLINFSLAIVTAIVVLSNQFARAFYDKISTGTKKDLPAYIVGVTQLQTISNQLTNDQIDAVVAQRRQTAAAAAAAEQRAAGFSRTFQDGIFASVGFHSTMAGPVDDAVAACEATLRACYQAAGCQAGADPQPAGCDTGRMRQCDNEDAQCVARARSQGAGWLARAAGLGAEAEYYNSFKQSIGDWSKVTLEMVVNNAIGIILLVIVVTTFLYAAVALGIRFFAIVFLTIASPIAFLTVALPMNLGKQQGWSHWWSEFLKWVFFAPAFYFLIYLTLLMAGQMHTAFRVQPGSAAITSDGRMILGLVVVLGLLMFAARLAKKTSGKMGEFTVGLAKKAGGLALGVTAGIATGGTLLAARGLARGAVKPGTLRERAVRKVAQYVPGGRVIQRAGIRALEEQKQDIENRKKNYGSYSNDQIQADFRGTNIDYTKENAARLATLAERRDGFKGMTESELKRIGAVLSHYNMGGTFAKLNPTLADESMLTAKGRQDLKDNTGKNAANHNEALAADPIRYTAETMTSEDIGKVNTTEIKEATNDSDKAKEAKAKVREGLSRNTAFGTNQIRDLAIKDIEAAQQQADHMNTTYIKLQEELDAEMAKAENQRDQALIARTNRRIAQIKGIAAYLNNNPGGRILGITLQTEMTEAALEEHQRGRRNRATPPTQPTPPAPTPTPTPPPTTQ